VRGLPNIFAKLPGVD